MLVAAMLIVSAGVAVRVVAQVSPGPLAQAHASLDGSFDCFSCHDKGDDGVDRRCLECHREIGATISSRRGLHGRQGLVGDCAKCHPDHAGRDFALIAWTEGSADRFDHTKTTFGLDGSHRKLACDRCHNAEFATSRIARLSPREDRSRGYVGLETACQACHLDVHDSVLGKRCEQCHDAVRWEDPVGFDHDTARYALTGRHREVACDACHRAERLGAAVDADGRRIARWKPLEHGECSACHADPHDGKLGVGCAGCHSTGDFADVDGERFDHAKTSFALRGRHADVACERCHDEETAWGKKPAFDRCDRCHADAHAGKALIGGRPADCASCHNEDSFARSTFPIERHQRTAFPLEGRHRNVPCDDCHRKIDGAAARSLGFSAVLLQPASATCSSCHRDPHAGQLDLGSGEGGRCRSCHGTDSWSVVRFSTADHARSGFDLQGKHARISCASCHGPRRRGLPPLSPETSGPAGVLFHLGETRCGDCHRDPHDGRFAGDSGALAHQGCDSCHDQDAFRPARFDLAEHERSRFPLVGAHRAVPCFECHAGLKRGGRTAALLLDPVSSPDLDFRETFATCGACHASPHGDQFEDRGSPSPCEWCHGMDGFRPASNFDHRRLEAFPLTGAHADVACARCHPAHLDESGVERVRYRPLGRECRDCHSGVVPSSEEGPL